ncbi:MAG: DUF3365 domain-containing protein [Salinivirgaceae bacterium]|nr:DUF3365 domain-containing protein [Salinivirgaceae bacterium]
MWNIKTYTFLSVWVVLLLFSATFNTNSISEKKNKLAKTQSKALFDEIVTTRSWNARHGGVYVPITKNMQPNPFLKVPNRDIFIDSLGLHLTMVNPAFMTRQISEIANSESNLRYHITSLKPIRPANLADTWETIQLKQFENNTISESFDFIPEDTIFRYMASLTVEKSCLKCHAQQGYKEGDISGGISVTIPATEYIDNAFIENRNILIVHFLILILGCAGIIYYQRTSYHFLEKVQAANYQIHTQNVELKLQKETLNEANKKLSDTNNTKDLLFSIVAHDLKNPFVSLMGLAHYSVEMLEKKEYDDLEEVNRLIYSTTEKTFYLLKNLLDWLRLQTGQISFSPTYCNFHMLISDVIELYTIIAKLKQIRILNNVETNMNIFCDKKMMETILRNLISNSIKFSNPNGEISIQSKNENNSIVISVSDNGVGISKKNLVNIFSTSIYRTPQGTNNEHGTGLGLVLVKDFVELHSGTIEIHSKLKQGTTVFISIPNKKE